MVKSTLINQYLSARLNCHLPFFTPREISTFETQGADHQVYAVSCYLTEKEAIKNGSKIDKSRELKPNSGLFFCHSWYELAIVDHLGNLTDISQGRLEEIADDLVELDAEGKRFCYDSKTEPPVCDDLEGWAYAKRPLNNEEGQELDRMIKEKIDQKYLPDMQF